MSDINLNDLINQFKGATLPQLIEKQIKSMNVDVLQNAIQGTYKMFPDGQRSAIEKYSLEYPANWLNPNSIKEDLSIIFMKFLEDIRDFSEIHHYDFSDDDCFNFFNLTVLRMSYFASENKDFRKLLGIKKGWFS